jgi:aspartyl-tRNA(Asn)/glutamyl-tRNA(Gln) amidotransferase subunit A
MATGTKSVRERLEQRLALSAQPEARNIFTRLLADSARREADAADARRAAGHSLGPLDGVIVSIKDLFDIEGLPTGAGATPTVARPAASRDAVVVERLREAGAVLIGLTNMTEFAFSGIGHNPHWGTPSSAKAEGRIPGGSTSGGAVSVARGLADVALGTDTGGSTRIPAAFNGIVGYKPTSHRVPKAGVFPLSYALDSVGPLAGSVALCATTDAVLAGEPPRALGRVALSGLRIGVPRGLLFEATDADVATAFEAALARLSGAGASVAAFAIDDLLLPMRASLTEGPIVACEAAEIHAESLASGADVHFDPRVRARIRVGAAVPAAAYIRSLRVRAGLQAQMAARLADADSGVDVLALPTVAIPPPRFEEVADDADFSRINLLVLRNTAIANYFDMPAISLPLPGTPLPVGLMLIAPGGDDHRLFSIAAAVEEKIGG